MTSSKKRTKNAEGFRSDKPDLMWHLMSCEEVERQLETHRTQGLSNDQAQARLTALGRNEIEGVKARSVALLILDQFSDFMIQVLIVAGVVAAVLGEAKDSIAIVVIICLNAILGFAQEFRAQRALAALKALSVRQAKVIREGSIQTIQSCDLVPGDIVLLDAGLFVSADIRLCEVHQLKVDEAPLTGESFPREKTVETLAEPDLPLGDRQNMLYKGTLVNSGRGIGVVVNTGMNTELGKIAHLLNTQSDNKTPLQKRLAVFGKRLAYIVIALCFIIFWVGILRREPPLLMFLTALSLAVAAIPEALPAVVTVLLTTGARRMV